MPLVGTWIEIAAGTVDAVASGRAPRGHVD